MSTRQTDRNHLIAQAAASGEPLKVIADRHGISIARVSQITRAYHINKATPSLAECQSTIDTLKTLLTNLNLQVLRLAGE